MHWVQYQTAKCFWEFVTSCFVRYERKRMPRVRIVHTASRMASKMLVNYRPYMEFKFWPLSVSSLYLDFFFFFGQGERGLWGLWPQEESNTTPSLGAVLMRSRLAIWATASAYLDFLNHVIGKWESQIRDIRI